jgi:DinB family protein
MHPQLLRIAGEFDAAGKRLHRLTTSVPPPDWTRRAEPGRWSIAECVVHLNLTAAAYVPLLRDALDRGRRLGGNVPVRYRRDPVGWLLWHTAGPPVRLRVKTTAPFLPSPSTAGGELVAEFDRLQMEQVAVLTAAEGLPLGRLWIISPFDPRIRYNVYACLTILPRHQHRHLWQAEQVGRALGHPTR